MWFGASAAPVRHVFAKARGAAPCVLFFDELDSIGISRGSGHGGGGEAADRVINQLLTEMDGIGVKKNLFVVGATNRPDILDDALLRPGRLDQLVYIPLPDFKSRLSIMKAILRKTPIDPKVSLDFVAKKCEKFSGADLKELCNQICKCAIKESIEAEIAKKNLMKDGRGEELNLGEDPVPLLTRRHFEYGLANSRVSVGEADLSRYEEFKRKFDPNFNQNKSNRQGLDWPEEGESNIVQQPKKDYLNNHMHKISFQILYSTKKQSRVLSLYTNV